MENNKLISMTDFVLQEAGRDELRNTTILRNIVNYAKFLKQPLELGFFVPTDEDGNVLEEPESYGWIQNCGGIDAQLTEDDYDECEKYHTAKSKVLFEGFKYDKELYLRGKLFWFGQLKGKVEDLVNHDITLTETTIKQIYG